VKLKWFPSRRNGAPRSKWDDRQCQAQSKLEAAGPTPSPWCAVPTAREPPSTSPTTCSKAKRGIGRPRSAPAPRSNGRLASAPKAMKRCRQHRPDQELDRLRRVRLCQAEQADLRRLINKAGKTVQPTIAAFQAAASNADWAKGSGYYVILTTSRVKPRGRLRRRPSS